METQHVDLGFRPRPWQFQALASLKRFSVLVVHRRGGKTVAAVMKLIDAALRLTKPMGRFAYIGPELKQAKKTAWDYLKHYALKIPGATVHEGDHFVEVPNMGGSRSRIQIDGADNPDSLRGAYYDGVVLDEVAQMKPNAWGEVIRPALADRPGWALFIGTPKGTNLLSELYFANNEGEWFKQLYTYMDTQALPEAEVEAMRAEMTPQQFRQEMLCDFNASSEEALISIDLVRSALGRHLREDAFSFAPKVLGVDVAGGGGDKTVVQPRQGLAAFKPDVFDIRDPRQIGDLIAVKIDSFKAEMTFVDESGGWGVGVVARLRELGYAVTGVQFGGQPRDSRYANKSAEMWWDMKCWLEQGGALPKDNAYLIDLTGRLYDFKNASGKLALESKDKMRARGLKSPDYADALALTFASPVAPKPIEIPGFVYQSPWQQAQREYDPYQRFAEEQKRAYG